MHAFPHASYQQLWAILHEATRYCHQERMSLRCSSFAILLRIVLRIRDMGVQIDGYIAMGAHTLVVGQPEVTGRIVDHWRANIASEVVHRMLRPGAGMFSSFPSISTCVLTTLYTRRSWTPSSRLQ